MAFEIEHTAEELNVIWRNDPAEVWRAIYSVADLWDFAYGTNDLRGQSTDADQLWSNARSAISASARTLVGGYDIDSIVQSSCLAAELAMKGMLIFVGWKEKDLKRLNHGLVDMAEAVISERPNENDAQLRSVFSNFPDYVKTRYEHHKLSRIDCSWDAGPVCI